MPWCPWVSASFPWEGWHSTAKGSDVRLTSLGFPPLLRGRRPAMYTVKGADVRPGVPCVSAWHNLHWQGVGCTAWRPFGFRLFCVVGVDQIIFPWGRIYNTFHPGVPWGSAASTWQVWYNKDCQRVGCTPRGPLGFRLFCVPGVR